ncbi:MAG: hypothetical protein ACP5R4_12910, partial [Armatimonadota bacterium]
QNICRMRKILRAFLWMSALAIAAGALVLVLALSIPPEPDPTVYMPQDELQKHSQSVRHAVEQLSCAKTGKNQPEVPIRLVLSEDDINAFLAADEGALRKMHEKNILHARVRFRRNQVVLSSLVDFKGRTVKVLASGALSANQKGELVFEPFSLRIGRIALPAFALADVLESRLGGREIVYSVPEEVKEIKVEDRKLILLRPKRTGALATNAVWRFRRNAQEPQWSRQTVC